MFNENNWFKYDVLYAVCLYGVLREFDTLSHILWTLDISGMADEDFCVKLPLKSVWGYAILNFFLGGMPQIP